MTVNQEAAPPEVDERLRRRNVVALGWVSFFGGFSQDMILPVLPLFYANVLGLPKEFIGLIEGILTTVVSLAKIGAGALTDIVPRRKGLVFLGYALSAVARPAFAAVALGWQALLLRIVDGLGKGIKDAPRDTLVAGSTRAAGWAFGLQRMLDTFGSVAGPLFTFLVLRLMGSGAAGYRAVFLLSGLFAVMTLVLIGAFVYERAADGSRRPGLSLAVVHGPFALFLTALLVFTLGNSSDAFLLLRAQNLGVSIAAIPLVYALFNFTYAGLALPAGILSDRIGRRRVILLGWSIYTLAYLGFAMARSPWQVWILYAFYGLYYATTEGVAKAMIADLTRPEERGLAYGVYNAAVGVLALPASVIAGWLWSHQGAAAPFYFGAAMAAVAIVLFLSLLGRTRPSPEASR